MWVSGPNGWQCRVALAGQLQFIVDPVLGMRPLRRSEKGAAESLDRPRREYSNGFPVPLSSGTGLGNLVEAEKEVCRVRAACSRIASMHWIASSRRSEQCRAEPTRPHGGNQHREELEEECSPSSGCDCSRRNRPCPCSPDRNGRLVHLKKSSRNCSYCSKRVQGGDLHGRHGLDLLCGPCLARSVPAWPRDKPARRGAAMPSFCEPSPAAGAIPNRPQSRRAGRASLATRSRIPALSRRSRRAVELAQRRNLALEQKTLTFEAGGKVGKRTRPACKCPEQAGHARGLDQVFQRLAHHAGTR